MGDVQPAVKKLKEEVGQLEKDVREANTSLMTMIEQAFNEEIEV